MSAPIVSWYNEENDEVVSNWDSGVVDAGQPGPQKTILVWNNRAGIEDVAHMQDCVLTTTDGEADTLDVVQDKWVNCRVDSANESVFTEIGGGDSKSIRGEGNDEGIIQGVSNDGSLEDVSNYAKVTLYVHPPLHGVSAGRRDFKLRASYFYV